MSSRRLFTGNRLVAGGVMLPGGFLLQILQPHGLVAMSSEPGRVFSRGPSVLAGDLPLVLVAPTSSVLTFSIGFYCFIGSDPDLSFSRDMYL